MVRAHPGILGQPVFLSGLFRGLPPELIHSVRIRVAGPFIVFFSSVRIAEKIECRGYKVLTAPEAATKLMANGIVIGEHISVEAHS